MSNSSGHLQGGRLGLMAPTPSRSFTFFSSRSFWISVRKAVLSASSEALRFHSTFNTPDQEESSQISWSNAIGISADRKTLNETSLRPNQIDSSESGNGSK